jgi:hypothetical protein
MDQNGKHNIINKNSMEKKKKRQLKKIDRKNEKKLEIFVLPQSKGI